MSTSQLQTASEVYARSLLPEGHGYPMWVPKPADNLPQEYRDRGVDIGDVGIVTSDGGFDFLFSVCLPANHPINFERTPEGFKEITINRSRDLFIDEDKHSPGSHVASESVHKQSVEGDFSSLDNGILPAGFGATVHFTSSSSKGGLLCLPDGAHRYDLSNHQKFRDAAIENAFSWYKHANGPLFGRMARSGSLYLVTGCDRSPSWGVASFSSAARQCEISLKFTACQIAEGNASIYYSWERRGPATVRVSPRRGADRKLNQCPFIRGFKISIREGPMAKIRRPVKLSLVKGNKPNKFIPSQNNSHIPFQGGRTLSIGKSPSGGNHDSGQFSGQSQKRPASGDSSSTDEDDMGVLESYHPSVVINNWLLKIMPDAQVAVTHEDEWYAVLDGNSVLPEDEELIRRISEEYVPAMLSDGAILVPQSKSKPLLQEHLVVTPSPVPSYSDSSSFDKSTRAPVSGQPFAPATSQAPHLVPDSSESDSQLPFTPLAALPLSQLSLSRASAQTSQEPSKKGVSSFSVAAGGDAPASDKPLTSQPSVTKDAGIASPILVPPSSPKSPRPKFSSPYDFLVPHKRYRTVSAASLEVLGETGDGNIPLKPQDISDRRSVSPSPTQNSNKEWTDSDVESESVGFRPRGKWMHRDVESMVGGMRNRRPGVVFDVDEDTQGV